MPAPPAPDAQPTPAEDAAFYRQTRRETIWILAAWAVFFVWVIGYSAARGYSVDPDRLRTVAGVPSWVFWGVGLPWAAASAFTIAFATFFMRDGNLGAVEGEPEENP